MQTKLVNAEAEKSIIACPLISQTPEMLDEIFSSLSTEDFFCTEYKTIFFAMQMLYNKGKVIDLVTLNETLERVKNDRDKTNYTQVLFDCCNLLPTTINYQSYISIVQEYSRLRKIEKITKQATTSLADLHNSRDVIQSLATELDNLELDKTKKIVPMAEATQSELELINKKAQGEVDNFGLATGFPVLDSVLWGLYSGELVVVGARAGVGKTAFALNILDYVGNTLNKPCLFFSLEMPKNQIASRLLSITSGVSNTELREPQKLNSTKAKLLLQAEHRIEEGKIYIDDTTDNTVQAMIVKARQLKRTQGLELVVVDYLQFVRPNKKSGNRFLDVGDIARELKVMARQLQVPVIALCQLNRALDNEERTPTMADLRESGEIENNADIIMFLHSKSDKFEKVKDIDLILGKFRRGEMRAVRMQYKGDTYSFKELDKTEQPKSKQIELTPLPDNADLPF